MKIHFLPFLLGLLATGVSGQSDPGKFLYYARSFADRLLEVATDEQGPMKTRMWASVIHAPTGKIPVPGQDVPPTEGVRIHDRAVWGSNLYHDISSIKLCLALSELTGDPGYQEAAEAYLSDFLSLTQNRETGLLGWGEHLYYHFYEDTVAVEQGSGSGYPLYHEFLGETPPWELLWGMDSARTRKAIEGLRFHFRGFQTQSYLFNRHAYWNVVHPEEENWASHQFQRDGQPWIKHSALLSFSFEFLHEKTGEPEWAEWARGVGELYWRHRHPETNLVVGCIDDPRSTSRYAQLDGMAQLAYWLFKSWERNPDAEWAKEEAVTMLKAIEAVSWDEKAGVYRARFEIDGTLVDEEVVPVFTTGYGNVSLLYVGQIAAYFARELDDDAFLTMLRRIAGIADQAALPEHFVINNLAEAVHFDLDAYALLEDPAYLQRARRYADIGIAKLHRNGLFARQPGDPYYEAKLGAGRFAQGLLRLHLALQDHPLFEEMDWSF